MGILWVRCCLRMVAAGRTWSKNFSLASSSIFTWGCFIVSSIAEFLVDAAPTWYVMLVLGGEGV